MKDNLGCFCYFIIHIIRYETGGLRPPGGSVKLIATKLTNIVSLEQSQLKPIGRYGGGLLKLALGGK